MDNGQWATSMADTLLVFCTLKVIETSQTHSDWPELIDDNYYWSVVYYDVCT
jgi:hypothetical protein